MQVHGGKILLKNFLLLGCTTVLSPPERHITLGWAQSGLWIDFGQTLVGTGHADASS